jgi:hypothetical protein
LLDFTICAKFPFSKQFSILETEEKVGRLSAGSWGKSVALVSI